MSNHTDGPWNICWRTFDGKPVGFHITGFPYGSTRSVCDASDTDAPEMVANAHLIAAAPNLLAALKLAADIIGHPDDEHSKMIADIIATAEGRYP